MFAVRCPVQYDNKRRSVKPRQMTRSKAAFVVVSAVALRFSSTWLHSAATAFASPRAAVVDAAGQKLLEWLDYYGAEVSPHLQVATMPPLGRELTVTSPVEAGATLLRVSAELCIPCPRPSGIDDENVEHNDSADMKHLTEDVRLAVEFLRVEQTAEWMPYCEMLPTAETMAQGLPVFWEQEKLEQLVERFPRLIEQVESRREILRKTAEHFDLPLDSLTWAHAVVSTRAIGAGTDHAALVPGVDMANHDLDPNADLVIAGRPGLREGRATVTKYRDVWEHGNAGLVAKRDIVPGEPVRISYGKYPNQRFILDYGFELGDENTAGDIEVEDIA